MSLQGFHHIALRAHDFDATVAFYTEALGFTKGSAWGEGDGRAIMLDAGNGNYLEVFSGGTNEPKPEGLFFHLALHVDDCDAYLQRAIAAGAEVTMEATSLDIPSDPPLPVRIGFVKGPNGEVVEFFQLR